MSQSDGDRGGGIFPAPEQTRDQRALVLRLLQQGGEAPDVYGIGGPVARPSTVAGVSYERVSTAYFEAVYSVLTGKAKAADAAAKLEEELVQIPGLRR